MKKSIIIIGAGMAGLAAGIYGQANGYRTRIFEMHARPGGQCTSWKRNGYTFDPCIHHLFGCRPGTRINALWQEVGALPRALEYTRDCVSALSTDGVLFQDLYDPDALEEHLLALSPEDERPVRAYTAAVRRFAGDDAVGEMMTGNSARALRSLPRLLPALPLCALTMQQFAARFSDPFLRSAFRLLEYSLPDVPFFLHLAKHGYGAARDIAWPAGGAAEFARSMEKRYRELGGEVQYRRKAEKILTERGRAAGVRFEDGGEEKADIVISAADGRRTILGMLGGEYMDGRVRRLCAEPPDETNFAVNVFAGVKRDLSREPSALVMLLDRPAVIAGQAHRSLEMQIYGFDRSMAPGGKGVVKVDLPSRYSYWKELYRDRGRYAEEKQKTAEAVITLLERRFPGIRGQVEEVDVPTLMTWERFMGGTHGFANWPSKKTGLIGGLFGKQEMTLPGLSGFYLAGIWATSVGSLFANAHSGKNAIRTICARDGRKFAVP